MSNGSTKCHVVLGRMCTSTCQRSLVCEKSKIININSLQCLLMLQLWTICPFYIFHEQTAATFLHFQVILRHSDNPCLFKCVLVKSWCQVPRIKKAPAVMMCKALASAKLPNIWLTDALWVMEQGWSCSHFCVGWSGVSMLQIFSLPSGPGSESQTPMVWDSWISIAWPVKGQTSH